MTQPTAASAETAQRCFSFAIAMLRAHGTAERRVADGPLAWCRCGRAAVVCPVNTALRAAELLPALDRPAAVPHPVTAAGHETGVVAGQGGQAPPATTPDHHTVLTAP